MTRRNFGDRVVVNVHGKPHPGTVVGVGRIGYVVRTDEPFDGMRREVWRHVDDVFDADDVTGPPATKAKR